MSNPFKLLFELRAVWFGVFYGVLAVVFLLKDRYPLRKPFVIGFFAVLCVTVVAGTHFLPFMAWDKFPNTYPETETEYELRVVTADGHEVVYDIRATLGSDGVNEQYLTTAMAEEYSDCQNQVVMSYLLDRAREYRVRVESGTVWSFARFPPHGLTDIWTKKELQPYSRFVGVRLYERTITSSEDGSAIRSVDEALLLEYHEADEAACFPTRVARGEP